MTELNVNLDGVGNANVIRVGGAAQHLPVHQLLAAAGGATACYADREVAWGWDCGSCGTRTRRLHVAHPAAMLAEGKLPTQVLTAPPAAMLSVNGLNTDLQNNDEVEFLED